MARRNPPRRSTRNSTNAGATSDIGGEMMHGALGKSPRRSTRQKSQQRYRPVVKGAGFISDSDSEDWEIGSEQAVYDDQDEESIWTRLLPDSFPINEISFGVRASLEPYLILGALMVLVMIAATLQTAQAPRSDSVADRVFGRLFGTPWNFTGLSSHPGYENEYLNFTHTIATTSFGGTGQICHLPRQHVELVNQYVPRDSEDFIQELRRAREGTRIADAEEKEKLKKDLDEAERHILKMRDVQSSLDHDVHRFYKRWRELKLQHVRSESIEKSGEQRYTESMASLDQIADSLRRLETNYTAQLQNSEATMKKWFGNLHRGDCGVLGLTGKFSRWIRGSEASGADADLLAKQTQVLDKVPDVAKTFFLIPCSVTIKWLRIIRRDIENFRESGRKGVVSTDDFISEVHALAWRCAWDSFVCPNVYLEKFRWFARRNVMFFTMLLNLWIVGIFYLSLFWLLKHYDNRT